MGFAGRGAAPAGARRAPPRTLGSIGLSNPSRFGLAEPGCAMPEDHPARRLRTFFVGTEPSQNPLVPKLRALGKELVEAGLSNGAGVLSARYGKRVLITAGGAALASLRDEDVVEIVDYDPQRNRCLLMGRAEPGPHAAVHWLVYSNREDAGAIVHVHDPVVLEVQDATQAFPESKGPLAPGSVELAVEALKMLRRSPYFVLKGHGCVAVGRTLDEALAVARRARAQAMEVIAEAERLEGGEGSQAGGAGEGEP